eukprot:GHVT01032393.1.p2 GENE.GHVT01032393.1~~GHVT01032393.1.p2  ORF type:complete len:160 (+),score=12.89 GHVT01032393.1:1170-1649(+)
MFLGKRGARNLYLWRVLESFLPTRALSASTLAFGSSVTETVGSGAGSIDTAPSSGSSETETLGSGARFFDTWPLSGSSETETVDSGAGSFDTSPSSGFSDTETVGSAAEFFDSWPDFPRPPSGTTRKQSHVSHWNTSEVLVELNLQLSAECLTCTNTRI